MSKDKENVCMDGPFEMELKVHYTDGLGRDGEITVSMGKGTLPTKENIDSAINKACVEAKKHGLRLMTREEVMQVWLASPVPVVVPGPKVWTEDQLKAWGVE